MPRGHEKYLEAPRGIFHAHRTCARYRCSLRRLWQGGLEPHAAPARGWNAGAGLVSPPSSRTRQSLRQGGEHWALCSPPIISRRIFAGGASWLPAGPGPWASPTPYLYSAGVRRRILSIPLPFSSTGLWLCSAFEKTGGHKSRPIFSRAERAPAVRRRAAPPPQTPWRSWPP